MKSLFLSLRARIALATTLLFFPLPYSVVVAQYAQDVLDLKKASDLYDERGFADGKAIEVDGNLVVSKSNGNVSYSYPISNSMVSGIPLNVALNYCGSVGFTTYGHLSYGDDQADGFLLSHTLDGHVLAKIDRLGYWELMDLPYK